MPLIEIVTKPITGTGAAAPEVAKAYVSELRDIVRALGVSDVRMEEGSMRCDANVSIAPAGAEWGTRTETRTSTRCARWSARCATRSAGRPR